MSILKHSSDVLLIYFCPLLCLQLQNIFFPWSVLLRSFPQSSDLTWFVFSFPIIHFGFFWSSYLFIEFPFHLLHWLSFWKWEDVKTLIKASPSGYRQMLNRNFRIQKGLELCFPNSERPFWLVPYLSPDLDSVITKNCSNKLDFNKRLRHRQRVTLHVTWASCPLTQTYSDLLLSKALPSSFWRFLLSGGTPKSQIGGFSLLAHLLADDFSMFLGQQIPFLIIKVGYQKLKWKTKGLLTSFLEFFLIWHIYKYWHLQIWNKI